MLGTEQPSLGSLASPGAPAVAPRPKGSLFGFRRASNGGSGAGKKVLSAKSSELLKRQASEAAAIGAARSASTSGVPGRRHEALTAHESSAESSQRSSANSSPSPAPATAASSRKPSSSGVSSSILSSLGLRADKKKKKAQLSWCLVCGKAVQREDPSAVSLRIGASSGQVHSECFRCASCHRALVSETFRQDNEKLYCSRHHGGYAQLGSALSLPRSVAKSSNSRAGRPGYPKGAHQRARSCGGLLTSPNRISPEPANHGAGIADDGSLPLALGAEELADNVGESDRDSVTPTNSDDSVSTENESEDARIAADRLQLLGSQAAASTRTSASTSNVSGPVSTAPPVAGRQVKTFERGSPAPVFANSSPAAAEQERFKRFKSLPSVGRANTSGSSGSRSTQALSEPVTPEPASSSTSSSSSLSPSPLPPRPESNGPPVAPRSARFGHFVRAGRSGRSGVQAHVQELMQKAESNMQQQQPQQQPGKSLLPTATSARAVSGGRGGGGVGGAFGARTAETTSAAGVRTSSQLSRMLQKGDEQKPKSAAATTAGLPSTQLPRIGAPSTTKSRLPPPTAAKPGTVAATTSSERTAGGIPLSGSKCTSCPGHKTTTSSIASSSSSSSSQQHAVTSRSSHVETAQQERTAATAAAAVRSGRTSAISGAATTSSQKKPLSPQRSHSSGALEPGSSAIGPTTVIKPGRQSSVGLLASRLQSPSRSSANATTSSAASPGQTSPVKRSTGGGGGGGIPTPGGGSGKTRIRPPPLGGKLTGSQENILEESASSSSSSSSSSRVSPPSPRAHDAAIAAGLPKSPLARSSSAGCATSPSRLLGASQSAASAAAADANPGVSSLTRRGLLMAAKYKTIEKDEQAKDDDVPTTTERKPDRPDEASGGEQAQQQQQQRKQHSLQPKSSSSLSRMKKLADGGRSSPRASPDATTPAPPPDAVAAAAKDQSSAGLRHQRKASQSQLQAAAARLEKSRSHSQLSMGTAAATATATAAASTEDKGLSRSASEQQRKGQSLPQPRKKATTTREDSDRRDASASAGGGKAAKRNDSNVSTASGSVGKRTPPPPPPLAACPYREDLPSVIDDSFLDDLQVYKALCRDVVEQSQAQDEASNAGQALQSRLARQQRSPNSTVSSSSSSSNGGGGGSAHVHIQLRNEDFQPSGAVPTSSDDWTTTPLIAVAVGYYAEPLKSVDYSNSFHRHSVRRNSSKKRRKSNPANAAAAATAEKPEQYYAIEVPLEEAYKTYFIGQTHWNFYVENDQDVGPCMLSLKQESSSDQERFRLLVRSSNCISHGCLPATSLLANPYIKEEVVTSIGKEIGITVPFCRTNHPNAEQELLRIDESFNSRQMKIGLVYVEAGQTTEEEMFNNRTGGNNFDMFMSLLGDRVKLKRFPGYRGGLDVEYEQTGDESLYSEWNDHQIMFHVAPLLPHHETDRQQVQKKRHIGNDMVLVVFIDDDSTPFNPTCIRSHFLHTFVVVHRSEENYRVDVVARESVPLFGPPLWKKSVFPIKTDYEKQDFREFFMTKLVNAYRASLKAPKFLAMKTRTTSQMLTELTASFSAYESLGDQRPAYGRVPSHGVTSIGGSGGGHGGSAGAALAASSSSSVFARPRAPPLLPSSPSVSSAWIPAGARRMSTPLPERSKQVFGALPQLARDLRQACRGHKQCCDVSFIVGERKYPVPAVRAILVVRSAAFRKFFLEPASPPPLPPPPTAAESMASLDSQVSAGVAGSSSELASLALEGTAAATDAHPYGGGSQAAGMLRKGLRASSRFKRRGTSGTGAGGGGGTGGQQQRKNSNLSTKSSESGGSGGQRQAPVVKPGSRRKSSSKSVSSSSNLYWAENQGFDSGADESQGMERSLSWQNLRPSSSTPHLAEDCENAGVVATCGAAAVGVAMPPRAELTTPRLDAFLRQLAPGILVFEVSEFSEESFGAALDYVHAGTCDITAFNLAGVLCAAAVLGLRELETVCLKLATRLLVDAASVVQVVAGCEAYLRRHPQANVLFDDIVVPFIVSQDMQILSEATITSLGQESMKRLYALHLPADDTTRFRAASLWAEAESHRQMTAVERGTRSTSDVLSALQCSGGGGGGGDYGRTSSPTTAESSMRSAETTLAECSRESLRKQLIAPLVRGVSLRKISAADLMKLVLPTGAFPPDQVMMALAFQADPTAAAYFGVGEKSPKASARNNRSGHRSTNSHNNNNNGDDDITGEPYVRNASTPQPSRGNLRALAAAAGASTAAISDGEGVGGARLPSGTVAMATKGGSLASRQRRQYSSALPPASSSSSPTPPSPVSSARAFFGDDAAHGSKQTTTTTMTSSSLRLTPSPTRSSRRRLNPSSLGRSSASLSPRRPPLQQAHPQLGGGGGGDADVGGGGGGRRARPGRVTSVPDVTARCETATSLQSASSTSPPPFFNSPDITATAGATATATTPTSTGAAAAVDGDRADDHSNAGSPCPPSPSRLIVKRGSSSSGGGTNRLKVTAL